MSSEASKTATVPLLTGGGVWGQAESGSVSPSAVARLKRWYALLNRIRLSGVSPTGVEFELASAIPPSLFHSCWRISFGDRHQNSAVTPKGVTKRTTNIPLLFPVCTLSREGLWHAIPIFEMPPPPPLE